MEFIENLFLKPSSTRRPLGGRWNNIRGRRRRAQHRRNEFSLIPVCGDAGSLPIVLDNNGEALMYDITSEDCKLGARRQVSKVLINLGGKS